MSVARSATTLLLATLIATVSGLACAQANQAKPSPEEMKKMMEASMGAMAPAMARMTEAMIEVQLNAAAKPETAQRVAAFKRSLYEALLKSGFTQDQAMQITVSTPLPAAAGAMR